MPRPKKQTVDYFPHYCNHGKTIFILEQRYQSKGYCFWFKLLEELGNHNGHYLNFNDESYLIFFSAKTMVSVTETLEMLNLLSELNAIDKELWKKRIVWCQNFIDNLSHVYDKRVVSAPKKPVSVTEIGVSGVGNPQSKVKESKVKESKVNNKLEENNILSDKSDEQLNKDVKAIIDYWFQRWQKVFNQKPQVAGAKFTVVAKPIIKAHGLEKAKKVCDIYFNTDDDFFRKQSWGFMTMMSSEIFNSLLTKI